MAQKVSRNSCVGDRALPSDNWKNLTAKKPPHPQKRQEKKFHLCISLTIPVKNQYFHKHKYVRICKTTFLLTTNSLYFLLDRVPVLRYHANIADPVQTLQHAASELGQHCLLTGFFM